MRNALTIARRDLASLFVSPLAYIFLLVFLVFAQMPFVLSATAIGRADLRPFFVVLPVAVTIFAALVTMRSWAEERQENTYEMLLTFPMRDVDLVVGKYLAALAFLAFGLAGTLTLPFMLGLLGDPDPGPMISGYFGSLLVASMWVSAGLFFSSLTRSQLLAALLTIIAAVPSLFVGFTVIRMLLDARVGVSGLGHALDQMIGTYGHYDPFARGVIDLADIAYYAGWTLAFLYMNTLWVRLRRHPQAGGVLATGVALALGCGLLMGRLTTNASWLRADMTAEKTYTLSPGTVRIFERAKVPVRATLYISPAEEMPTDFKNLERDITDRLREIQTATGGKLVLAVEYKKASETYDAIAGEEGDAPLELGDEPAADPKTPEDAKKAELRRKEKRLLEKGVKPFAVESLGATETSTKLIYATLGLAYREKDEELIQPLTADRLADLEYLLAKTIARLTRERAPKIAVHLGKEPISPELAQMYRQMGRDVPEPYSQVEQFLRNEQYDVVSAGLNAYDGMPEEYDALVVVGPTRLDERAQWEINRALVSGKPTILAVQRYTWGYQQTNRGGLSAQRTDAEPGIDGILEAQGLGVSRDVLMDEEHETLMIRTGGIQDLMGGTPVKVPTHIHVKAPTIDRASPVTQRIQSFFYLWGTALALDEAKLAAKGLKSQVLFRSSEKSASVDATQKGFALSLRGRPTASFPLAAEITGQFADAFAGKPRPKWAFQLEMTPDGRPRPVPADSPETPVVAAPGRLILVGCARSWQNGILNAFGNETFLLNALDSLTQEGDLLSVRSKQPAERRLEKADGVKGMMFHVVPLVLVPGLILAAGIGIWLLRERRRERWVSEHGR